MFGKKKNEDDSEKLMKVSADNLTMITIGTIVKGIITIAGGLHLEGTLEGDIICKGKVVIGPQGKVKGNVNCDTAVLYGLLQGDIRAMNELYMKSGCMVKGDVYTRKLEIEPNAGFDGVCNTTGMNVPVKARTPKWKRSWWWRRSSLGLDSLKNKLLIFSWFGCTILRQVNGRLLKCLHK